MLLFTMLVMGDSSRYKVKLKADSLRIQKSTRPPSLCCMINNWTSLPSTSLISKM